MSEEKEKYIVVFTHNDLDGIGCATLLTKVFETQENTKLFINYVNYNDVDEGLTKFMHGEIEEDKDYLVIVADITPTDDTCEKIDNFRDLFKEDHLDVLLFDHHKTRERVKKYDWATFDKSICGTKLIAEWLNENFKSNSLLTQKEIDEFASAVNSWDLWMLDAKDRQRGENLNNLLYFIGNDSFIELFKNNLHADTEKEYRTILEQLSRKRDRYVNKVVNDQLDEQAPKYDGYMCGYKIFFATDYLSEIGHAILSHPLGEELKYVCIVNPITNTVSLRARDSGEVDVGLLAKELGGGGHKGAAGFRMKFTKAIEKKIEKRLEKINV